MVTRIKGSNIEDGTITIADIDLSSIDTDDVSEGANNQYFTTARANTAIDNRVTQSFVNALNVNADTLDSKQLSTIESEYQSYTNNAIADVQTQIDTKAPLASPTFTGTVTAEDATLSGTAPVLTITDTDNSITAQIGSGTSDFNIATITSHNIDIRTGNTRRMVVENDGDISFYEDTGTTPKFFWDASAEKLGIGTSGPLKTLHLNDGATNSSTQIRFQNDARSWDVGVVGSVSDRFIIRDNTGTSDVVRIAAGASASSIEIDSSGNIGIKKSSPQADLHISDSAATNIRLEETDGSSYSVLQTDNAGTLLAADLGNNRASTALRFSVDSTERMRIDSSGNVGIGATNNSVFNGVGGNSRIVAKGSDTATDVVNNSNASITIANDDGTANNLAGLHFARADTDDNPHYVGASIVAQFLETQVTGQYPKAELSFLTSTASNNAPSEKMRISASGAIGIGGANYGTAGQVLTSSGSSAAPTWADAGGGGAWEYISTSTASNSTSVVITLTSGYAAYLIKLEDVQPTDDSRSLEAYLQTSGGSTFTVDGAHLSQNDSTGSLNTNDYAGLQISISQGNQSSEALSGLVTVISPKSATSLDGGAFSEAFFAGDTGLGYLVRSWTRKKSAGEIGRIEFAYNLNSISQGTFRLYGLNPS